MRNQAPDEVMDALDGMMVGENKRINHEGCSKGNDGVLSITRLEKGWWYECFRCGDDCRGFVKLNNRSCSDTVKWISRRENETVPEYVGSVAIPNDVRTLDVSVHLNAYRWLYDMEFTDELIAYAKFGWSNSYNRLIMPVLQTNLISYPTDVNLIGWVGRNLGEVTTYRPKTLTQKMAGIGRVYYTCYEKGADRTVIVEDIPSAIKVWWVCRCNTVALLGSGMTMNLIHTLKSNPILLWLDDDMRLKKAIKMVKRCVALGYRISHKSTFKDPKDCKVKEIRDVVSSV
jgi:hypothetical protein